LIEGIDVPAIEAKIAQYQEENAEQIMINRARKVLEKEYYVSALNFCHFYPIQVAEIYILCFSINAMEKNNLYDLLMLVVGKFGHFS
jgi:hypothetical protein